MILPFFRKAGHSDPSYAVYNAIVAQSRREIFYAQWGVSDTLTGRFDMISLHAALVMRRLRSGEKTTKEFSQNLFDVFFLDMDRSLRELGVGDLSVGKRIEKMGSLFYGLLTALNQALDSGEKHPLEEVLSRNFHDGETHPSLSDFADYVLRSDELLSAQELDAIRSGTVTFGEPK